VRHLRSQEPQAVRLWGRCTESHGAQRALDLGCSGVCLRTRVFLGKLSIDIEHVLTKQREIIEGVSETSINRDVSADTHHEPSIEVEAGPVHVNDVVANLGSDGLEFGVVFKNRMEALHPALDGEMKLTSIIHVGEACLERLDEFIESGELGGRRIFHHELEFGCAGKEQRRSFHFFFFIHERPDVCMNFEDPGIDDGEGCVLS